MRKVILLATLVILLFASILYYRIESVRGNLPSFSNFSFLLPSSKEEYSEEKNEKDLLVTMSLTHTENIKASEKILPSITDEALQNHIGSFIEIQRDELGKINSGLIADYYSGGLILVVSAKSPSLYPNLDGVLGIKEQKAYLESMIRAHDLGSKQAFNLLKITQNPSFRDLAVSMIYGVDKNIEELTQFLAKKTETPKINESLESEISIKTREIELQKKELEIQRKELELQKQGIFISGGSLSGKTLSGNLVK